MEEPCFEDAADFPLLVNKFRNGDETKEEKLVLESSVRFGLLSIFGKTETRTGLSNPTDPKKLDRTAGDRFYAVFCGLFRLQDQS